MRQRGEDDLKRETDEALRGMGAAAKMSALVILVMLVLLAVYGRARGEGAFVVASFYSARHAMSTAHKTLKFGTCLVVARGSRKVRVHVRDRGPFIRGRTLDLSRDAAHALGMGRVGVSRVHMGRC
jgi:hypothetical protein